MLLKKRDIREARILFELMTHPEVFPYVRQKAYSQEEYIFLTKQTIEQEERQELISRTILNELGVAIGTINLFDIADNAGFLGTWLGKEYHGKGYNQLAKDLFFNELFSEYDIDRIYMKVRKCNIRSQKAVQKLPYAILANDIRKNVWNQINADEVVFDLYEIPKELYFMYKHQYMLNTLPMVAALEA